MRAYRVSVNLKLGLISFAVVIAVASLWYTTSMVDRLKEREEAVIQLWAKALERIPLDQQQVADNPFPTEFRELEDLLIAWRNVLGGPLDSINQEDFERYRQALLWAQSSPRSGEINFIQEAFFGDTQLFGGIPAIVVDSTSGNPGLWRNVRVGSESMEGLSDEERAALRENLIVLAREMALINQPIPIVVNFPETETSPPIRFVQYLYYGESELVARLRWFPYVQLLFVGLFVMVGYFGFSYIRRSEQSSLWVGMAKEAAHQLGTPISSLMGWLEMLRLHSGDTATKEETDTYDEIEKDIARLERVTARFSDIGSLPKLEILSLATVLTATADYIRRRIPQSGSFVNVEVNADSDIYVPLNAELFEWVIENLLKNALDAMESGRGTILIEASQAGDTVRIDVTDSGKGIDRRQWKNVFRPGYSTKKRGWGLGLSLAKRIVEDYHGGSLTLASSRPGIGTTFRIELPV
ncbi:MAG: HAMP domain-containing sensor histidine kinase [Bacteroidetes bacterium]|nr:HAMP domain-containing sensor histidine kinase [Bacteroidota bacterium]